MVKCRPMKFARADRSLIAWMLYCCVLFNVFACSIGHGQMVGMQLNGIGGQFCTVDPRTQAPSRPTPPMKTCPRCPRRLVVRCAPPAAWARRSTPASTSRCCRNPMRHRRPSCWPPTSLLASPGPRLTRARPPPSPDPFAFRSAPATVSPRRYGRLCIAFKPSFSGFNHETFTPVGGPVRLPACLRLGASSWPRPPLMENQLPSLACPWISPAAWLRAWVERAGNPRRRWP